MRVGKTRCLWGLGGYSRIIPNPHMPTIHHQLNPPPWPMSRSCSTRIHLTTPRPGWVRDRKGSNFHGWWIRECVEELLWMENKSGMSRFFGLQRVCMGLMVDFVLLRDSYARL